MMYSSWGKTLPRFTPETVVASQGEACEKVASGQSPVSVLVPGAARRESAHQAACPVCALRIFGQLPSTICSLYAVKVSPLAEVRFVL